MEWDYQCPSMIENGDAKYSSEESELWPSVLLLSRRIPDKVDLDFKRGLFQGRVKQTIYTLSAQHRTALSLKLVTLFPLESTE